VRRLLAIIPACGLIGCVGGSRVALAEVDRSSPGVAYVIFSGPRHILVDSLHVAKDTMFARELAKVPNGDRPAVALPVIEIDSITRAHPDRSALFLTALPAAILLAFGLVLSQGWGSD
jgi:hypothetical protein